MAERLVLRLLGNFEVEADDQPVTHFEAATARALLAYLATHRKEAQARAMLATFLWGLDAGPTGLTNLRSALRRVRNAIDTAPAAPGDVSNPLGSARSCLLTDRETVQLNPELTVTVDVDHFELLLRANQSHDHPADNVCEDCIRRCRAAVDLYRGPFLADLTLESEQFDQWRTTLQERFRRQVLHALSVLTEHEFRQGSLSAAESLACRQLEIEHWSEEAHRQLMRVLLASGRRSAALAQYEICRQVLATELGAVPAEETDALYDRILAGVAPPAPVQRYNPYKGLAPFAISDALYFYGREVMTNRLLTAVGEQPLVALVGASGSGKSSVLHAGLAASLELSQQGTGSPPGGRNWRIASMRPGTAPLSALADELLACGYTPPSHGSLVDFLRHEELTLGDVAAAILGPAPTAARFLLIVDQFEEVFTLCREPAARASFLHFVLSPLQIRRTDERRVVLLLAMRADFLGQALQHRELADALQEHTLLLGPMARSELQRAIEEPARLQGAALEPGLVDRLLDDVGAEPGRLPLLQFALGLLWLRQQDGWLTHATYDEIGGLRGALTDYADDVFLHLSLPEQLAARRIFLGLVEPGLDAQDVRHLATRSEIGDAYWPVVQQLADARLVVTNTNSDGDEIVELAHEALIREWKRLREWLATDREFRRWQQQMRIAAEHWRQNSEDESTLLYGVRLAEAERWSAERQADINPLVQRYIAAGIALRDRRQQEELARQQRELAQVQAAAAADRRLLESEQASRRRLRRLTIGIAIVSCIALGAAVLAWQAQLRSEDNARVAHARQAAAQAVNAMYSNPDLALLLASESLRLDSSPENQTALFGELDVDSRLQRVLHGEPAALRTLGIQGEQQVLVSNEQGAVAAWDLATGQPRNTLPSDAETARQAHVSPRGDRFLTTAGATATLWDSTTFASIAELARHTAELRGAAFTPDGSRLITVGDDGLVLLWDAHSGEFVQELLRNNDRTVYGPVRADGTLLLLDDSQAGEDAFALWDTTLQRQVGASLVGHTDALHGYDVSPDGQLLATASFDGSVRLWDTATGAPVGDPLVGHAGRVLFAVFSPDGKMLATGATDSQVLLWDVATGTQLGAPLKGHSSWVRVAGFSDGGRLLTTGDDNGQVLVWDLSRQQWLQGHTDRVRSLALSPDQATLATSGFDKRLIIWDAGSLARRQVIDTPHAHAIISVEFSPDGKTLVSVDGGGYILFWDTATWEPRFELRQVSSPTVLIDLAFTPDSSTLAAGAFDGVVRLWNVATGEELPDPIQAYIDDWALSVAFDPTGTRLATGGVDGAIKLWDVATRQPIAPPITGHSNRVTDLVYSPDGKVLASSSADGTVRFWNAANGTPAAEPYSSSTAAVWNVVLVPPGSGNDAAGFFALSGDGAVAWWDTTDHKLVRPLLHTQLETEEMKSLADGSRLFLASTGLLALALTAPEGDWAATACAVANRSLTEAEWDKYMTGLPYAPVCR